jgi:nucleotide-binding universal stress UspA family protein
LANQIGAKATALTVLPPSHMFTTDTQIREDTPAQSKARMQEQAEKTLGAIACEALAAGVACETVHVEHEHPYQAIIETAESKGCDLIVMASQAATASPRSSLQALQQSLRGSRVDCPHAPRICCRRDPGRS